jgi:quercetin dioxygenase-like cupin family protein
MALRFEKGLFATKEEALADIAKHGTWPTTFISGPSDGLPVHWHDTEVHGYVIEGETDFLDVETDTRTAVAPGDKVIVPAKALHAEGVVKDRVVYLIALPDAVPPEQFLVQRSPDDL